MKVSIVAYAVNIADQVVPFLQDCCSIQLQICKNPKQNLLSEPPSQTSTEWQEDKNKEPRSL
jgi:hypothetical protein